MINCEKDSRVGSKEFFELRELITNKHKKKERERKKREGGRRKRGRKKEGKEKVKEKVKEI